MHDPLHPDFVPSIFPQQPSSHDAAKKKLKRYARHTSSADKRQCVKKLTFEGNKEGTDTLSSNDEEPQPLPGTPQHDVNSDEVSQPLPSSQHQSTNTNLNTQQLLELNQQLNEYIKLLLEERDFARKEVCELRIQLANVRLSSSCIRSNDARSKFYTGLSWSIFEKTFNFLSPHVQCKTKDSLPFMDQFFLTLVRLRLDLSFELLAYLSGCGETTVRDYFWKWVDIMYAKLNFLVKWPDPESIILSLPPEFKEKFPRLTSIIDCFELFIDMPGNLVAHQQTYSNYKKHTTVKVLISCSPLGAVTFLSLAWGGRVSDVDLVRQSGFISSTRHRPGDQILADRGFPLEEDFAALCSAELVIPSFTKGKSQLSAKEVETSREKSTIRIHVERVIGLLKNRYTILQGTLPIHMIKSLKDEADKADLASIDRLLTVCASLVNLGGSIVFKG